MFPCLPELLLGVGDWWLRVFFIRGGLVYKGFECWSTVAKDLMAHGDELGLLKRGDG